MEKILRRKFIYISCGVVFFVLFIIAFVINAASYIQIDNTSTDIATIILENDGEFPRNFDRFDGRMTAETPFTTRYFAIKIDNNNNLISADTRNVQMANVDDAIEYANAVIESGKTSGFLHHYKYLVGETDYGYILVFVDYNREMSLFNSTLLSTIFICSIAMLGVLILTILLSKSAVAPIVKSYTKQQQFITNVTHELKTPLAIIKTNTEVIEIENGESEWSKSVHHQISRLNELVNYLVSLSKLEEGDQGKLKVDFSISDAVQEVCKSFEVLAENSGNTLDLSLEKNISYYGDEQTIRLLLSILMDNAIKYSVDDTRISVSLKKEKEKIHITTQNEASGLKIGKYNDIFERFYRLETSRNSSLGGFGIGLAVAKSIAKNHGGNISAESLDGINMTIKVIL